MDLTRERKVSNLVRATTSNDLGLESVGPSSKGECRMKIKIALVVLLVLAVAACALAEPVRAARPANPPAAKPNWWGPTPNPTPTVKGYVVDVGPTM